jgi:hypothetical protein
VNKQAALTVERLRELLHYDQETGIFTHISGNFAGKRAGSRHPRGYVWIKIGRWSYAAHRLAWVYVNGRWPNHEIDHRNGVRDANWIDNLRESSVGQNNQNTALYKNNKSGSIGVTWSKAAGRWRARIDVDGKQTHLGVFESKSDAAAAYLKAKAELHRFQPRPRYA